MIRRVSCSLPTDTPATATSSSGLLLISYYLDRTHRRPTFGSGISNSAARSSMSRFQNSISWRSNFASSASTVCKKRSRGVTAIGVCSIIVPNAGWPCHNIEIAGPEKWFMTERLRFFDTVRTQRGWWRGWLSCLVLDRADDRGEDRAARASRNSLRDYPADTEVAALCRRY